MTIRQTITALAAITAAALALKTAWRGLAPTLAAITAGDHDAAVEITVVALCLLILMEAEARRRSS